MRTEGKGRRRAPGAGRRMIIEVSAGGILFDDERLLVLCKPNGEWIMPKGHVEAGETPEEAAIREVAEESGLLAKIRARVGQTAYSFRVPPTGEMRLKRVHWFLMDVQGGQLRIESNFCDGKFLTVDEALRTLTFPNDRRLLRLAARKRSEESTS